MKELITKINKLKTELKVGIVCLFMILASIILAGFNLSLATNDSTVLRDQVVEGLEFKNANLVYSNGISTLTAEVKNTNNSDFNLKTIKVIFKDENDNTTTLIGYIGNTLSEGEKKKLSVSVDEDITNIKEVTYFISK